MRGSSFTTFLVFLPLVAIPVLAVFGIPEFQPVIASSPTEAPGNGAALGELKEPLVHPAAGQSETPTKNPDLPFFKNPDDRPTFPTIPPVGEKDPFLPSGQNKNSKRDGKRNDRLDGWEIDSDRRLNSQPKSRIPEPIRIPKNQPAEPKQRRSQAAPFPGTAFHQETSSPMRTSKRTETQSTRRRIARTATAPKTVQEAIDRLRRLGIVEHHVGHGPKTGVYYFRCYAPSKVNSRVSRLLEEEDTSLLRAACKVLARVESQTAVN